MGKLLDMRQWGLASLDKEMAHLKHKDGHEMHVSIQHLPKLQQEQIKRIKKADGGPVLDPDETKKFEQGFDPSKKPAPQPEPAPQNYADKGLVQDDSADDSGSDSNPPVTININGSGAGPSASVSPQQPNAQQPNMAVPSGQPSPNEVQTYNKDLTPNLPSALRVGEIAEQQKAEVAGAAAKAQEPIAREGASFDQQQIQDINKEANSMKGHVDEFRDYMNANPLNPRHYMESMDAEQKKNTATALLLGGFAQGLGAGNNPAMDFLNKQIDRDIDAQKVNADRRNTIYGAYSKLYDDQIIANKLTHATMLDRQIQLTNKIAAQLGTQQALAQKNAITSSLMFQRNADVTDAQGRMGALQTGTANPLPVKESEEEGIAPILGEGAAEKIKGLSYTKLPNMDQVQQQFTVAQQADKALSNLKNTFETMSKNLTTAKRVEQLSERTLGRLPLIGSGVQGVMSGPAEAETESRTYESAKTSLRSDLTNALRGTNITSAEVDKIVDDNSPVKGDGPSELKQKRDTIEGFIRRAVPTSHLQKYGLTGKIQ